MNREIKFRAWDKENEEMIYWEDFKSKYEKTTFTGFFTAEHLVPLQYTGLKDKNGKEIYTRDILEEQALKTRYLVKYNPPHLVVDEYREYTVGNGWQYKLWKKNKKWNLGNILIIGNLYENKELLEEK